MRRGGGVTFAVCGFWWLMGVPGCGARSALLSDFAGEGGASSGHAGDFGRGGEAATSTGGRAGNATGGSGAAAAGGAPPQAGGPTTVGGFGGSSGFGDSSGSAGRAEAGNAFGGASLGGNAGLAGRGGEATICDREEKYGANLLQCAQGFVHREHALACPLPAFDDGGAAGASGSANGRSCPAPVLRCDFNEVCQSDADCPGGGYCIAQNWFSFDKLEVTTGCLYPCRDDTECFATELCACRQFTRASTGDVIVVGDCYPGAGCKVDADCGPGQLCGAPLQPMPFAPDRPPGLGIFSCTSPRDECRGNVDCPPPSDPSCCAENLCSYGGQDHLHCTRREHCEVCN